MTYRPAAASPRTARARGWNDAAYGPAWTRRVSPERWRSWGISADVAAVLAPMVDNPIQAAVLAEYFSLADLRRLCAPERGLTQFHRGALVRAVQADAQVLDPVRAYLRLTTFTVADLLRLVALGIDPTLARRWQRAHPPLHQHADLAQALTTASVLHDVPREHLNGWVTYALTHPHPRGGGGDFLGGRTGLLIRAGLSPAEASTMPGLTGDDQEVARTLGALAGLRLAALT